MFNESVNLISQYLTIEKANNLQLHYMAPSELETGKPYAIFIHGANRKLQNAEYWNPLLGYIIKCGGWVRTDTQTHRQINSCITWLCYVLKLIDFSMNNSSLNVQVFGISIGPPPN